VGNQAGVSGLACHYGVVWRLCASHTTNYETNGDDVMSDKLLELIDKLEADNLVLAKLLEVIARKQHVLARLNNPKRHQGDFEKCQDHDCLSVRNQLAPSHAVSAPNNACTRPVVRTAKKAKPAPKRTAVKSVSQRPATGG